MELWTVEGLPLLLRAKAQRTIEMIVIVSHAVAKSRAVIDLSVKHCVQERFNQLFWGEY